MLLLSVEAMALVRRGECPDWCVEQCQAASHWMQTRKRDKRHVVEKEEEEEEEEEGWLRSQA